MGEWDRYLIPREYFLERGEPKILRTWFLFELSNLIADNLSKLASGAGLFQKSEKLRLE